MAKNIDDNINTIREELEKIGSVVVDTRQMHTNLAFLYLSRHFGAEYCIELKESRNLGGKLLVYKK